LDLDFRVYMRVRGPTFVDQEKEARMNIAHLLHG